MNGSPSPANLVELHEKSVLVIGAASGIGRASAQILSEAGAQMMLADIHEKGCRAAAEDIVRRGGRADHVVVDAGDEGSVVDAIAATIARFGRLQVLVNSAGLADLGSAPGKSWHDLVDLYLKGPYYACRRSVDAIEEACGGSIINVASIAGVTGSLSSDVDGTGQETARHGLIGLTRTMALTYAQRNIRVNAVCPGYVRTRITSFLTDDEEAGQRFISDELRVPMNRWGEPRQIGAVVAFVASDAASFITGQPIVVDGGFLAR